jgi:cytochrome c556
MDDQFLHQLRREPPAAFAARLKWHLDRPPPARRSPTRLILGLAICGTAFALISPPGRLALESWFATAPSLSQTAPPEISRPDPATNSGGARIGPLAMLHGGQPRQAAAVPPVPAPASLPDASAQELQADTNFVQSEMMPTIRAVSGVPQTPEAQAATAVSVRQGLFLNLGFVVRSLSPMLQRDTRLDRGVVRTAASRLQTLAPIIPEVFGMDTRPFNVNTRALESIWMNGPDFASKADDLTLAANALAAAVATDDDAAIRSAIRRIGVACQACHDDYRRK